MHQNWLEQEASKFRLAIETARDAGDFIAPDRMARFPTDCCDDTADLFTHYLFHQHSVVSMRVDGSYYHPGYSCTCGHSWQVVDGWVVDLTGDQFQNDTVIKISLPPVFVGKVHPFYSQFKVVREETSCGIECLGEMSHTRMYGLYSAIMKYMPLD